VFVLTKQKQLLLTPSGYAALLYVHFQELTVQAAGFKIRGYDQHGDS